MLIVSYRHQHRLIRFAAAIGAGLLVTGCSWGVSTTVDRSQFGEEWPLIVPSGLLSCDNNGAIYIRTDNGKTYSLNAQAAAAYPAVDPIWAADASGGARKSLDPLVAAGEDLCRRHNAGAS